MTISILYLRGYDQVSVVKEGRAQDFIREVFEVPRLAW
jgi:hypothetical protein